jgi:glycosyltransferase involved in cell wall biosynthesis
MKIAIVCDWLVAVGGAEKVLKHLLLCFPEADLFAVIDFVDQDKRDFLLNKPISTTFIQHLPFAKTRYRNYLPLMPLAISRLDLSAYDLILSSSHAVAKGVKTAPHQTHISYVHTPMRYAWDLQDQYLQEANLNKGIKGHVVRYLLKRLREWDLKTAKNVQHFIANSNYIAARIQNCYQRDSEVIYPPVETSDITPASEKQDYYLTASRLVPYKRVDLIVDSFNRMPDKKLVVIGAGPEFEKIKAIAGDNITLLGEQPRPVLVKHMQEAKAFIFAAEEDFGITPVEAQAAGTPIIAFGKGGALETVIGHDSPHPTGLFFPDQTQESLINAVKTFETNPSIYSADNCVNNAKRFSVELFQAKIKAVVERYRPKYE